MILMSKFWNIVHRDVRGILRKNPREHQAQSSRTF